MVKPEGLNGYQITPKLVYIKLLLIYKTNIRRCFKKTLPYIG